MKYNSQQLVQLSLQFPEHPDGCSQPNISAGHEPDSVAKLPDARSRASDNISNTFRSISVFVGFAFIGKKIVEGATIRKRKIEEKRSRT